MVKPSYPLASVDNVLRLLTLLADTGELRVSDAAEALGVAPSTAHRLLSMLRYREFALQDGRRVYRPGPALQRLASRAPQALDLSMIAHPHLAELARTTDETAHLVVLEGNGSRFIDGVDGTQVLRVGSRLGMLLPAWATSGGKALLAELAPEDLAALFPHGLPQTRETALHDTAALQRELAVIRRRGFAINVEESERGIVAIGTCVRNKPGVALASVVLAAPSARCPRSRMLEFVPALLDAAARISADL